MATVEYWNKYAQQAQENLERVRGEVREKINDPNTSTADRDKAIIDLETQEHYVNWVQEQNAQIQQTGVIPSTMSIDSWSAGSGIWQDGQGKYRPARFINEPVAGNQQRIGTTYTQNVADLDGNVISFRALVTNTPSSSAVNFFRIKKVDYNSQTGYLSQFSMIAWDNEWYNQWKWRFGTSDSYKEQTVPSSWSSFSNYACISGCLTAEGTTPPVHTAFNDLCGVGDWDLVNPPSFNQLFKIIGEAEITGGNVDPENPWDFFNDNINPNIDPENSIFPGGYDPVPDKPDPDPPDLPGETENAGDDIDIPETLGVGATLGFVTQYCLNASQISELGAILWTSFTDPDYWKNFMFSLALDTGSFNTSALLDFFLSLRVYPFPLVNVPTYAAWGQDMYVGTGTIPLHFTTALHTINNFCEWIDAGHADIPFTFGDFRDYSQEIILYLPFCGTVQLEPADVLGGRISVKYAVDFATGACTAVARIDTWDEHHYPIAILPGQIGADVPLSATTAGQIAARLGSDVINIAGILSDGFNSAAGSVAPIVAGVATENPMMIAAGAAQGAGKTAGAAISTAAQALNMIARPGIGAPMLSGGRGFSAFGCPQKCYVQIRAPFYDPPPNYAGTEAHPAATQVQVSACSGLSRFVNPNVSAIEANEEEKEQIRRRLIQGVIV